MEFVSGRTLESVGLDQDKEVRCILDSIRSETEQRGFFELEQVEMTELSNKFHQIVYDTSFTNVMRAVEGGEIPLIPVSC